MLAHGTQQGRTRQQCPPSMIDRRAGGSRKLLSSHQHGDGEISVTHLTTYCTLVLGLGFDPATAYE